MDILRNLLVASVLLGAAPALAQSPAKPAPASSNGWRVECANNGQALDCRAVRQVMQNRKVVTVVAVRVPKETGKPVVLIRVPLGILVSGRVGMRVDDDAAGRFDIQTCTPKGCFAGAAIPDTMAAAMRTGKALKVEFQNLDRQTVTVSMPLAGFTLAYDKIK